MPRPSPRGGPEIECFWGLAVYILRAAPGGKIRYVGLTSGPRGRWICHVSTAVSAARKGGPLTAMQQWILDLHARGRRPTLEVVERLPLSVEVRRGPVRERWTKGKRIARHRGRAAEREWIRRLAREGHPLFNVQHARASR